MIYNDIASMFGIPLWLLIIALVWSMTWKALALWKSARKGSIVWFVVILIVNTMGILEIIYIFALSGLSKNKKQILEKKVMKRKKR